MSRKNNALLRIILYSLALVILLGGTLAAYLYSTYRNNLSDSLTLTDPTDLSAFTFSADELNSFKINWASGMITISPNELLTDTITVKEFASAENEREMILKRSGKTLEIVFCKTPLSILGISNPFNAVKDLYIEVPADWYCKDLEINAGATPVNISHMDIGEAEFNLASADFNMDACKVNSLTVDTASGNLNFNGELQELECNAASADCNIRVTNIPGKIECNSATGDLELSLPENCGFRCEAIGLDVNFNSEFPTTFQDGNHIYGDGSCKIEFNTLSGSLTIRKLIP